MILPELLDSNLNPVRRIQPIKASVRLNLTPLSTAELDLVPGDTIPARSLIAMYTVQGFAGVYRSSTPNETYGNRATRVHLEHAVAEIGDWIVGEEVEETIVTAASAISSLFASYGGTLWSLGTLNCSVNVRFSASKGQNVLESLLGIVSQVPGYMLTLDQSVTPWKIGIALQPETVTAEGRLSRNMTSVQITYDESELCNKVYINGIDTPFEAYDSQTTYGVIEHYISESDLPAATAQMVALAYLQAHCDPAISVSISMLDLANVTGETLDRITLGAKFRLALPEDGVSIEQHVIGIQFDDVYGNPEAITVTLANEISDTVAYLKKQRRSGRGSQKKVDKLEKEHQRYETKFTQNDQYFQLLATDSEWTAMGEQHVTAYSRITQSSEQIQSVVVQTGTSVLAKPFDAEHQYEIGDLCTVNGVVYEFTERHIGDWNPAHVKERKTLVSQINQTAEGFESIVTESGIGWEQFSPLNTYHVGDRVTYLGKNYICTTEHQPGTFTTDHFTVSNTLQTRITQNATDISGKVSQGDLAGYMTISAMQTAFGNTAVKNDGTITKAEFSTSVVDGIATAGITAEKIKLTGGDTTVKLSDRVIVADAGYTIIKGQLSVITGTGQNQKTISLNNGKVTAISGFQVGSGGSLSFVGGEDQLTKTIDYSALLGMIKTATLNPSTNTLTLTKFNGEIINFSKAATPVTLTGLWSGNTYTATPSSGDSVSTTVSLKTVSDLTITSTDSQIQDHGKFVTASGTVTIRATTGNLDGQGNPEYVDVLTSSFSGRDITDAYNEGWEAGNAAPSTTTVTGGWSGGTYTATAMPQNVQAETSLYGIVLNGDITKNTVIPKAINVPLKVVYDDGDPQTDAADKPSTGFTESISVDASLIYTDGQNSVSATFGTYSGTPGTATELSAGAYEFKITKDGTTTEQTFYTVPAAPSPVVPKVSKGTWQNGSIVFTAGASGDDTSTLKLYTSGAYSGTLDNVQSPTKVSFSILEDTGSGTTAATGATIFANISTTTGTLKLGNFNETNNTITVSLDTKPSVNVGGSSAIQPGVTQKDIVIARGTAQPNTPQWNASAHTYTITADGSFSVGGQSISQTQGFIDGGFVPSDAIAYGRSIAKGISSITTAQTNATAYGQAGYEELPAESNGYYILTVTPTEGDPAYRKYHVPASGGPMRYATGLTEAIVLTDQDTGNAVTKTGLRATYTDGNSDAEGQGQVSVTINASAVYEAGQAAAEAGNVDVVQGNWAKQENGMYKCVFSPATGGGASKNVVLDLYSIIRDREADLSIGSVLFVYDRGSRNSLIDTVYYRLQQSGGYVYLTKGSDAPTIGENILARIAVSGGTGTRSVSTLSTVVLAADHTSDKEYNVDIVYSDGFPGSSTIKVDASAISGGGDNPRTALNTTQTIVLSANDKSTVTKSNLEVIYDTGEKTSTFYTVIDASAVYQQGRADGAGQTVMGTITGIEKYLVDQKLQEYDEENKRYKVHVKVNGTNIENAPYYEPELLVPATSAYNHGFRDGSVGFEQATVTLQGQRVKVNTRGNSITVKKQPSSGTTVKPVAPGSEKKFRYYNEVEMFTQNANGTYTSRGKHKWWYEDSDRGTSYYLGQSDKTYYAEGTTETYWLGGTAYYYEQGTTDTTTYYKKSTQSEGGTT